MNYESNISKVNIELRINGKRIETKYVQFIGMVQTKIEGNIIRKKKFISLLKKHCMLVEAEDKVLEFRTKKDFETFIEECGNLINIDK